MTQTISRAYNSHAEARAVVQALEAAGIGHNDISILASNADDWYKDGKSSTYPDRDLDGKDDRGEAAATGAGVGAAVGGTAGTPYGPRPYGNTRCRSGSSCRLARCHAGGRGSRRGDGQRHRRAYTGWR